jgi:hypothetical protein
MLIIDGLYGLSNQIMLAYIYGLSNQIMLSNGGWRKCYQI